VKECQKKVIQKDASCCGEVPLFNDKSVYYSEDLSISRMLHMLCMDVTPPVSQSNQTAHLPSFPFLLEPLNSNTVTLDEETPVAYKRSG